MAGQLTSGWPGTRGYTDRPLAEALPTAYAECDRVVALIGSGNVGVYAVASPALEVAGADIDVVGVPGVTAALAAAAPVGEHRRPTPQSGWSGRPAGSRSRCASPPEGALDPAIVEMLSVVVGSTNTRVVSGRMVTLRGYRWMAR